MCGISLITYSDDFRSKIDYRGPDETNIEQINNYNLCFHRLSINDLSKLGSQPFQEQENFFVCNGEIYNHVSLKEKYSLSTNGNSDCEVVFRMILNKQNINDICNDIDGVFAFIYISKSNRIIVARDPIGVRPLYYGEYHTKDGIVLEFASEMKEILHCKNIKHFPPGHFYDSDHGFFNYEPLSLPNEPNNDYDTCKINSLLTNSVKKRLMSDRPVGFFLSGGLDSSIIAAIGAKLLHPKRIHTFSIGVKGYESPDLLAADKVAKYLNSYHHVYEFTIDEALEQIENVIWHLESYDCTTIRASIPMFLLSKYVSDKFDIKVILSGEGSDEIFGGYLYFENAPNHNEFHAETIRLLKNVHQFDVLRADKCTAGNGLELRVPFFDKTFVEYITNLHPLFKIFNSTWMEKTILRRSFEGYLPHDILWRQKNGMSDAVGYSWVDNLKHYISKLNLNSSERENYQINTPLSNEELHYRKIYTSLFGENHENMNAGFWRPKWTNIVDPSARQLSNFKS